jgi:hypothetical protein
MGASALNGGHSSDRPMGPLCAIIGHSLNTDCSRAAVAADAGFTGLRGGVMRHASSTSSVVPHCNCREFTAHWLVPVPDPTQEAEFRHGPCFRETRLEGCAGYWAAPPMGARSCLRKGLEWQLTHTFEKRYFNARAAKSSSWGAMPLSRSSISIVACRSASGAPAGCY